MQASAPVSGAVPAATLPTADPSAAGEPDAEERIAGDSLGELPDGFWDDDPVEIPTASAPRNDRGDMDRLEPYGAPEPHGAPERSTGDSRRPPATAGTTPELLVEHPLFAELQSLFPGRVLEVERDDSAPLEDTPDDGLGTDETVDSGTEDGSDAAEDPHSR